MVIMPMPRKHRPPKVRLTAENEELVLAGATWKPIATSTQASTATSSGTRGATGSW